jgi:predicted nucleotide-binding protein (sugar kinase/HSP70/actin superfamily)
MPRALTFYDMFPYWRAFFAALEIDIVLSGPTTPRTMHQTAQQAALEMCLPARLTFGHVSDLLEKDADFLFMPSVVNRENIAPGQNHNVYCPFIQSAPHLVATHMDLAAHGQKLITFPYFLQWEATQKLSLKKLSAQMGIPWKRLQAAAAAGRTAQQRFYRQLRRRGQEVLADLSPHQTAVVIIGRPYNTADLGACQDLPYKLRRLGVCPIPMDFLPLETVDISKYNDNMFWRSGQDILAAANLIREDPRLQAIYLTNFGCGPDSFIISFFSQMMGDKPFLELEFDDHTADAGILTRCEAFLESLQMDAR